MEKLEVEFEGDDSVCCEGTEAWRSLSMTCPYVLVEREDDVEWRWEVDPFGVDIVFGAYIVSTIPLLIFSQCDDTVLCHILVID